MQHPSPDHPHTPASHRQVLLVLLLTALAWLNLTTLALATDQNAALPPLPQDITSFGAAVAGDWVYVYGGHTGDAHQYSVEDLTGAFHRLNLKSPTQWEVLPGGMLLQGLALVSHEGSIYRVGGLTALNQVVDDEHIRSTDSVMRFDPAAGQWRELTPLPLPRSSHDAVVHDGKLYVIGGWNLHQHGDESNENPWHTTALVADLSAETIQWKELPAPPFQRRALAVAAAEGLIYAIGGIQAEGGTSNRVDIYDIKKQTWTQGPDFPADGRLKAFGASAFAAGDTIFATAMEGKLCSIRRGDAQWTITDITLDEPRFFHRLLAHADRQLIVLGGAAHGGAKGGIETIPLATFNISVPAPEADADQPVPSASAPAPATRWPGFRGTGNSHSKAANLPIEWSAQSNLRWTHELPGYGQSSPVIWDGRVFATSVTGTHKETLHLTCLDLVTGAVLWQKQFGGTQKVEDSGYVSKAPCTPVVDGRALYALFESGDLIALDHQGKQLWKRSLTAEYGDFQGNHGIGASLAQTDDAVIVLIDHGAPGYLLSIDKRTGENRWKLDRPRRVSWSSPLVSRENGRDEIIISSNGVVQGYDAARGEPLWQLSGLERNTVSSPSVTDDLIFIAASDKNSCLALRRGGAGELSDSHVAWRSDSSPSDFSSPLVLDEIVIYINKAGVADALDRRTGSALWSERLGNPCWASPIVADGRVYFFGQRGTTIVARPDRNGLNMIATNDLPTDTRVYGAAVVSGGIVIREGGKLVCIAAD